MRERSQALVTALLVGSAFLAGVDLFIVNVAFDEIARDFGSASLGELSWVLTSYAVVFASLLVPMGRLADRAGRKRVFVLGTSVFVAASVACGLAPSVWWLVAFRVVQAGGAAAMTPAGLGLLLAVASPERRAATARLWATTGALAAALGPALGGGLVQWSWQWSFWINLPLGLVLIVGAVRLVPDVAPDHESPVPDVVGAVLLTLGIGALVLGIVQGHEWGWTSTSVLAALGCAVLVLALFARRVRTHPEPIITPELLAVPAFRIANLATLVFNVAFGAALLGSILYLQQVWQYGALRTGLAIAVGPMMVPLTSVLAHRLLPAARPGRMIAVGSVLFGAAALWQAALASTTPAYLAHFLPPWLLAGVGVGLAMPNLVSAATASLPPALSSTGGGVVTMARQVGLALGVALLVALLGTDLGPDSFAVVWRVVAAVMALAALTALRIDPRSRRPASVSRPALAVGD